jgi:uncharacterized membrane protein YecN with MAPEG domain
MPVPITGLYAALLTFVAIWLTFGVGALRGKTGISLYDGGNKQLAVAIRKHANFTEHVPLALILLALLELNGGASGLLHALGAALVAARIAHPLGLEYDEMRKPLRGFGAFGTILVTLVAALALVLKVI